MVDYFYGNAYRQSYKNRAGVFSLTGDRVSVKPVYLTADEEAELDKIKSNYSAISEELGKYHAAEEKANKEALMSSAEYKPIFEKDEFKAINIEDFSVDELNAHLDKILLKYAKEGNLNFALKDEPEIKPETKRLFGIPSNKSTKGRYGNLFKKNK